MKAIYCPGTHWDREWYEPFQGFRMWLVDLIDEAMEIMDKDPGFRCFDLDGQTIVLEDYLEIRPDQRDRLVSFLREGRLVAGPWYNLPDEWLISGESFIRNIMRGTRICRELGFEPMQFAYTPDQFGHIAALPMIMNGFGLNAGLCWRGTSDETHPAFFNWVGPDGSRMVTFKLNDFAAYAPFKLHVRERLHKEKFADETYDEAFRAYLAKESARSPVPLLLMLDAIDHDRPDPHMPHIMAQLAKRFPDIDFEWGRLDEFAKEMMQFTGEIPDFEGELREPCHNTATLGQYLIVHTISSRYPLKNRNGQCQALLEKWAEPYALFDKMTGGNPIEGYLDKAWQYLMRNHPHDSICGCSLDQVHRDMMYRFDQCQIIGDGIVKQAFARICDASADDDALRNLVVHNSLPFRRNAVVEFPVIFKNNWPHSYVDGLASSERINRFKLIAKDGSEVPYQIARIERAKNSMRLHGGGREATRHGEDHYHLAVELEVPACGYTTLSVEPTTEANRGATSLMAGPLTADNGLIGFSLNPAMVPAGSSIIPAQTPSRACSSMRIRVTRATDGPTAVSSTTSYSAAPDRDSRPPLTRKGLCGRYSAWNVFSTFPARWIAAHGGAPRTVPRWRSQIAST